MITTLLILAVSSNVVLSLGMVGALSIVRFRTAIKEPMDIAFLFWAIAVGIVLAAGLDSPGGAGQRSLWGWCCWWFCPAARTVRCPYILVLHCADAQSRRTPVQAPWWTAQVQRLEPEEQERHPRADRAQL